MGHFLAELFGLQRRETPNLGLNADDLRTLHVAIERAKRRLEAEGKLENELNAQREIRHRLNAA